MGGERGERGKKLRKKKVKKTDHRTGENRARVNLSIKKLKVAMGPSRG